MMKKLLIFTSTIFMMACSNDEQIESANTAQSVEEVKVVSIEDGVITNVKTRGSANAKNNALSFSSIQAFDNFKKKLAGMTSEDRITYIKKLGVESLKELEKIADDELEEIGNSAHSEDEFRNDYEQYKKKYEGILIPNDKDDTDLNLYAPDGENLNAFVANSNQLYVINNQIVKAELNNTVDCISNRVMANNSTKASGSIPTNSGSWSPKSGKKIYFEASMKYEYLWVDVHARKKMWYGWKNDPNRDYYLKTDLNNFIYTYVGQYGQTFESGPLPIYVYKGFKKGVNKEFGKAVNLNTNITGQFRLWTDITVEYDENGDVATENVGGVLVPSSDPNSIGFVHVGGTTIPKCLDSKAHYININLAPLHR